MKQFTDCPSSSESFISVAMEASGTLRVGAGLIPIPYVKLSSHKLRWLQYETASARASVALKDAAPNRRSACDRGSKQFVGNVAARSANQ